RRANRRDGEGDGGRPGEPPPGPGALRRWSRDHPRPDRRPGVPDQRRGGQRHGSDRFPRRPCGPRPGRGSAVRGGPDDEHPPTYVRPSSGKRGTGRRMRVVRGRGALLLVVAGLLAAVATAGYVYSTSRAPANRYRTATVDRGTIVATVSATGQLNAV